MSLQIPHAGRVKGVGHGLSSRDPHNGRGHLGHPHETASRVRSGRGPRLYFLSKAVTAGRSQTETGSGGVNLANIIPARGSTHGDAPGRSAGLGFSVVGDPGTAASSENPLESLARHVMQSQLPLVEARRRAAEPTMLAALSPDYINALLRDLNEWARKPPARAPVLLGDLLVAATEAMRSGPSAVGPGTVSTGAPATANASQSPDSSAVSSEGQVLADRAGAELVELSRNFLISVPDGRVYRRAMQVGREVEGRTRARFDLGLLSGILHRLGALNLDPYCAGRSNESFSADQVAWHARLTASLGDAVKTVHPEELVMPEPLEAFRLAEGLFAGAAELRTGLDRGRSRKGQGEAMLWRLHLGDPVDREAIVTVFQAALPDLTWESEPQARLVLLNDLRYLGHPATNEAERLLERSMDDWAFRLGPMLARDLVMQAYRLLRSEQPRQVLHILAATRPLSESIGEDARIAHLRAEVTLLSELDDKEAPVPEAGQLIAAARAMVQQANSERWDVERLFSRLVRLAAGSMQSAEEPAGLMLLADARTRFAPLLAAQHASALDSLVAQLQRGIGVNGFNARDWQAGIEGYAKALVSFLKVGMPGLARDCLDKIVDLTNRPAKDATAALAALKGISPIALRVERLIGYAASAKVRRAAENILGETREGIGIEQTLLAMQMAKGLRFATALYGGSRYGRVEDPHGLELLQSIAETEASLPKDGTSANLRPLDEESLVSEYIEGDPLGPEVSPRQQPEERLSWLRRRYDVHVWDKLLEGAEVSEALWLRQEDLQACLDDRTAIISYFLGTRAPDGSTAGKALVATRRRARTYLLPDAVPEFGDSPSVRTAKTRRLVQDSPGPRDVSQNAARALTAGAHAYLEHGPIGECLSILEGLKEEGIDHLCIVPHGPLHYYPLHLAGAEGHPLADDWIVTYLPNLHLFVSRRGRPAARRHRGQELTSIGLDFEEPNVHCLPPLRGAVSEATTVAATFAAQPVAEPEATEARVGEALENSRFVHLATHGRHNVDAPAFQCMYFTPDALSDGVLYAHEILRYDLRGLDLVTMSVCETALGRFDISDNLRGIPAAMLLSGASTLIGTLWETEDATATYFFESLYRRLRAGEACLDAFRGAQVDTRNKHSEYRDWGAFYVIGDWEW